MNLFLDTVSPKNVLILFDDKKKVLKYHQFDAKLNESTKLIEEVDNFLKSNDLRYFDLENIVVVNGPGSFTGIRTTILLVNTINFVIKKKITTLTYFDLFDGNIPILKTSSKKDSFLKLDKNSKIIMLENSKILDLFQKNGIKTINSDIESLGDVEIISDVDYEKVIKNLKLQKNLMASSFYLKKPSISQSTC